jgi:hypothetical protein
MSAATVVRQETRPTSASLPGSPASAAVSFFEIVSVLREEREIMREERGKIREELELMMSTVEKQRQESEAKVEAQRKEIAVERKQMDVEREAAFEAKVNSQLTIALQARFEVLHAAQLISDEVLSAAEDAVAEEIVNGEPVDGSPTSKLIALSAKIPSDRAFARQLERKIWL